MDKLTKVEFLRRVFIAKEHYKVYFSERRASEHAELPVSDYHGPHGQWLMGLFVACHNPKTNDAFDVYWLAETAWEEYCKMPDSDTPPVKLHVEPYEI